jgi:hypothetical protein
MIRFSQDQTAVSSLGPCHRCIGSTPSSICLLFGCQAVSGRWMDRKAGSEGDAAAACREIDAETHIIQCNEAS